MPQRQLASRRHRRVRVRMPARVSTIDAETDAGSGRRFFRTSHEVCTNLSRGGLFLRTAEPLEPGRRLVVELDLPDGRPFEAVARVAWVKVRPGDASQGVGVEFLGGATEQFECRDAFLRRTRARAPRARRSTSDKPAPPPTGSTSSA